MKKKKNFASARKETDFLVRDLETRYGRHKSGIGKNRKKLKIRSFRKGTDYYITLEDLQLLDDLHTYLEEKKGIVNDFVRACIQSGRIVQKQYILEPSASEQPESEAIVLHSHTSTVTQTEKIEHLEVDQPNSVISSDADECVIIAEILEQEQQQDTQDLNEVNEQAQQSDFQKAIDVEIITLFYPQEYERVRVSLGSKSNIFFPNKNFSRRLKKFVQFWRSKLRKINPRARQNIIYLLIGIAGALMHKLFPTMIIIIIVCFCTVILIWNNWELLKTVIEYLKMREDNVSVPINAPETGVTTEAQTYTIRHYRKNESARVSASLQASTPLLVIGDQGMGKTFLAKDIVTVLEDEGYNVVFTGSTTHKQLLLNIASQLGIHHTDINGKRLTIQELEVELAYHLQHNTVMLIIDDAHKCNINFRRWLKDQIQRKPILLLATNPPKTDVFINLSRIELRPLPEYAIREIMEQAALGRKMNLTMNDLARLQEKVGGNPMFAQLVVEQEYIGVDTEAGDHKLYFDMTPLILLVGVGFTIVRFLAVGGNNPALYMLAGSCGALFGGVSYLLRSIPKESNRF